MSKRAPDPPDYGAAAEKQSDASKDIALQQTYANRPTQNTPWGNMSYSTALGVDPATGKPITHWSQNTTLSPEMQRMFDAEMAISGGRNDIAQGMMGNLGGEMQGANQFWDTLPGMGTAPNVPQYGGLPGMGTVPQTTASMGQTSRYGGGYGAPQGGGMAPINQGVISPEWMAAEQKWHADQNNTENGFGPGDVGPRPDPNGMWQIPPNSYPQRNSSATGNNNGFMSGYGLMSGFGDVGNQQRNVGLEGLPDLASAQKYYDEAGDAVYDRATGRLDPMWGQAQQDLEQSLANKGLRTGDQLYNTQQESFTRGKNDAYGNASLDATMAAGSEAARMFGMDLGARQQLMGERFGNAGLNNAAQSADYAQALGRANFNNQTVGQQFGMERLDQDRVFNQDMAVSQYRDQQRQQLMGEQLAQGGQAFGQGMQKAGLEGTQRQQAITEQLQRQGWSLNMINALLGGNQVGMPQMPGFMGASAGQAPQYLAAANMGYNGEMNQYNSQQMGMQGLMGGAASMMLGMGPQGMGWFGK